MRLGVSNLAWPPEVDAAARHLLRQLGVAALEVAPGRVAPWEELSARRLAGLRAAWDDVGIPIGSMQAIFYGCPAAQLLGDAAGFAAMASHMRRVADIAHALGAGVAVFGAMRHRARGERTLPDAMSLAAERLRALGDIAAPAGLMLAIEPVPAAYGCDFITGATDALDLAAATAHSAVRTMLDTAAAGLAGDDPAQIVAAAADALVHVHASEPGLGPFAAPAAPHQAAAAALHASAYRGTVVVEMLCDTADALPRLEQAVRFAHATYGAGAAV